MPRIQPIHAFDAGLNISGRFLDNMVLDVRPSRGVELVEPRLAFAALLGCCSSSECQRRGGVGWGAGGAGGGD